MTVGNRSPFIFERDSQNNKPGFGARPHISKRAFRRPKPRAWKVELEYLPMVHSAARHYVSAFLAKPEPVSKPTSPKLKHIAASGDLESRALQKIPAERAANYDLEVPSPD